MLTPAGQEAANYIASVVADIQQQVSNDIPKEDMETFYRVLFTLHGNFQQIANSLSDSE